MSALDVSRLPSQSSQFSFHAHMHLTPNSSAPFRSGSQTVKNNMAHPSGILPTSSAETPAHTSSSQLHSLLATTKPGDDAIATMHHTESRSSKPENENRSVPASSDTGRQAEKRTSDQREEQKSNTGREEASDSTGNADDNGAGKTEKKKAKRFRQTRFLMSEFSRQAHPDAAHRERLSKEIPGLSPRQVQVWFQNRRAKLKRLTNHDRDRMLKSRALPENFDRTQILQDPCGTRGRPGQPFMSPGAQPPSLTGAAKPFGLPDHKGACDPYAPVSPFSAPPTYPYLPSPTTSPRTVDSISGNGVPVSSAPLFGEPFGRTQPFSTAYPQSWDSMRMPVPPTDPRSRSESLRSTVRSELSYPETTSSSMPDLLSGYDRPIHSPIPSHHSGDVSMQSGIVYPHEQIHHGQNQGQGHGYPEAPSLTADEARSEYPGSSGAAGYRSIPSVNTPQHQLPMPQDYQVPSYNPTFHLDSFDPYATQDHSTSVSLPAPMPTFPDRPRIDP